MGASGSGTSTLGRALASHLATQHFDVDDFYWLPTDPPFRAKRPVHDREALMQAVFVPRRDWILSGSLVSWGQNAIDRLTAIVFVTLPAEERMARLRAREFRRYGEDIAPGGPQAKAFAAFMSWAERYDTVEPTPSRNRATHEAWLALQTVPVHRVEADHNVDDLVTQISGALSERSVLEAVERG